MGSESTSMYSTDDVAVSDRFAYWREVICAAFVQLRAEPVGAAEFCGSISAGGWNDVTISRVSAGGQRVSHAASDPRDDCLVSVQLAGVGRVRQAGREVTLRPGDFSVYDASMAYQLGFDGPFEQIVVQFPRRALLDRHIDLERAVAVLNAGDSGITGVVTSLVTGLDARRDHVPDTIRAQLGGQVVDCLASALSMRGFGAPAPETWQAARKRMVLDHVERNFADPDLTVESVSRAFRCTTRSLQMLFAGGETLSGRIRTVRLDRAADALQHPRFAHLTISRIGADHGFGDPAAFARAFRRHTGRTPSEVRAEADVAPRVD